MGDVSKSRFLRNFVSIARRLRGSDCVIKVCRNGKSELVVMSEIEYKKRLDQIQKLEQEFVG